MRIDFGKVRKGSKCAIAIGYDVDMPGDLDYLYVKDLGWRGRCHGHLNEDVIKYIRMLVRVAEGYGVKLQFFLQGNTLEDPAERWIEIAKRGHAIDQHTYSHISLLRTPLKRIESEVVKTKRLIENKLKTVNIGLRGPGGYTNGLQGRSDVQQVLLDIGIKFVSTQYIYWGALLTDKRTTEMIADVQPYYYETGLLEIPFCGYQDRTFFDRDCGPRRGTLKEWIEYLKRAVDFVHDRGLVYSLVVHPSTGFKHDPEGKSIRELLSYCRQKEGTLICTYRDLYQWIAQGGS
jgi:peptidoglycan/xylan/chitin deacetylase (PgdA/CDA1 family)